VRRYARTLASIDKTIWAGPRSTVCNRRYEWVWPRREHRSAAGAGFRTSQSASGMTRREPPQSVRARRRRAGAVVLLGHRPQMHRAENSGRALRMPGGWAVRLEPFTNAVGVAAFDGRAVHRRCPVRLRQNSPTPARRRSRRWSASVRRRCGTGRRSSGSGRRWPRPQITVVSGGYSILVACPHHDIRRRQAGVSVTYHRGARQALRPRRLQHPRGVLRARASLDVPVQGTRVAVTRDVADLRRAVAVARGLRREAGAQRVPREVGGRGAG
jgi:hypothetical protein